MRRIDDENKGAGKRERRRRRWSKVAAIVAIALVVLVGAAFLILRLTAPAPLPSPAAAETKELPAAWLAPTEESAPLAGTEPGQTPSMTSESGYPLSEEVVAAPAVREFSTRGSLAFYNDGRSFGEESYSLRIDEDGGALHSTGQFRFRALVATIRIVFEQSLELDAQLVPTTYRAGYDAPLGMDREIAVDVVDREAFLGSGETMVSLTLTERTIALGTFSTYALLPFLMAQTDSLSAQAFDVLVLGGPPGSDQSEGELPVLTILPVEPLRIRAQEQVLLADAYVVSSILGESLLLAKGPEFLAFLAGDGEETMSVLRSDLFSDGMEILPATGDPLPAGVLPGIYP